MSQQTPHDVVRASVGDGGLPGAVGGFVGPDRAARLSAGGVRTHGETEPMTTDTVLAIYSMTKAITAAAAMQLVEQGRLSLDGPAGDILDDLRDLDVLEGFGDDGTPTLRPSASAVTLRQLLTHTSGFTYEMWNANYVQYLSATGAPSIGTSQKAALRVPLAFDPGTRWEYGIGIDWAGLMVEAVSGQTLGTYCRQHLFEPLGMTSTAFAATPEMSARRATLHLRIPDGFVGLPSIQPPGAEFESGGGGLLSTVGDYLRFTTMLLDGGVTADGERVLSTATVDTMLSSHTGTVPVTPLRTVNPVASNDVDFFPGAPASWGLSFLINDTETPEGRPAGSASWAGLGNLYYWIDRVRGASGVFATQLLPFFDNASMRWFRAYERAVNAALDA